MSVMTVYDEGTAQWRWDNVAVQVVRMRRQAQSVLIGQCIQIANRYNADFAIPVLGTDPDTPHPVLSPALINEAIDIPAIRASSTNPIIDCPWLSQTQTARDRATNRRKILASTWSRSHMELLRRRFYRHVAGYAMGALVVLPDDNPPQRIPGEQVPPLAQVALRNPLTTYADPRSPEEMDFPKDVGFVHQMSASKLRALYPQSRQENGGTVAPLPTGNPTGEMYDVLEWCDAQYTLIGIMGRSYTSDPLRVPAGTPQLLRWYPNRLGFVPAVVPTVITLDKIVSRLTHMIGKADVLSYLWELDIAQTQRAMAPDRYVIAADGETPEIVSNQGHWIDGRTGEVNLLSGVKAVGELRSTPDPNNMARLSSLERNARQETNLLGPSTGETSGMSGSLRTGRGIDSLMSASIDPAIAELQEIGANAFQILNEGILACYRTYWPDQKFVVFSGWPSDRGMCTFTPRDDIDTVANAVYYSLPGSDAYAQTVQLSQMVQAEMMSKASARRMHPFIDDADSQEREIAEERINSLVWQAIAQRAAQGGLPPIDAAALLTRVKAGDDIEDAIMAVDAEARARQASQTEQGGPIGTPAGAPSAMPGLGTPGEGSEAGAAPQQGQQPVNPQQLIAALTGGPGATAPGAQPPGSGPALPVPATAAA